MKNLYMARVMVMTALLAAFAQVTLGQTVTAQLTGTITDASGAVIPEAKISVINVETGIQRTTSSNPVGYYTVPLLPPGRYRIDVEKQGFQPIVRSGITLHVNQVATIDFVLQLGAVTETVSVVADAPLLEAAEGSLGTVVENAKIVNLPLNGRNPFDLVLLTPGTHVYGRPDFPGNNIPLSNFSTNGGPSMTNEILLDGIPNTAATRQNEFIITPSIDAVDEFKVQSNSIKAEFGRTGGGVVNLSLKSGTNQFRGTLFEFLRNDKLDANHWLNNRSGKERPPFRFNQFGGTLGGPIAREKTFFFVNYEGLQRRRGKTFLFTVPREDMRRGDFSRVQDSAGRPVQIFDPLTTRPSGDGTGRIRDSFPGNIIPRSRMDQVAVKMLDFWPNPNLPGDPRTGANNFISTAPEPFSTNLFNVRVDHKIGNHHLFGRFSWDEHFVKPPNVFGNIANPASGPQLFTHRNAGLHDTWTINPATILTFRLGFARLRDGAAPLGQGFNITELGLPPSYAAASQGRHFPSITVEGMTVSNIGFGTSSLGPVADNTVVREYKNYYTGQADATIVRGKHVVKFGADGRVFRTAQFNLSNAVGLFTFNPGFTQGPDPARAAAASGHAFASYLLGTVASGRAMIRPSNDFQSYYLGVYVQDDFKVAPGLTLNLGLRYDVETCLNERYNKLTFLDASSVSPIQARELGRQIVGGVGFVSVGGNPRAVCDISKNNWGPRFGFAYTATRKTVVRGGYGILYLPQIRAGTTFQEGFAATTPHVASVDGFTPINFLRDPFPDGLIPTLGSSLGLRTSVGLGFTSAHRFQASSYVQQWNFGIQQILPGNVLAEIAYAGSKGTHLDSSLELNQIPDQFLSLGNELSRQVSNPFSGQIPADRPLGRQTVIFGQLLRPFPHFTSFGGRAKTSSSIYHSMQLRIERRFSDGFTFLAAYTASKLIDDGAPGVLAFVGPVPNYQNHNNRRLERSISSQEVPQRFVISYVYELPVGPGKRFLGTAQGAVGKILGGWHINGINTFQSGSPLTLGTASNPTLGLVGAGTLRPDNNGKSAKVRAATVDKLNRYFDISVFSQPAPWKFGTTARTLPDVRGPGVVNFDFALAKTAKITERHTLQFRAEAFNILNNTNFDLPGTVFGTPTFGVIGSAGPARILQFGLKWHF